MSKMQKYIAGALVLCVAFFGLMFTRVIAKPATKFELVPIPEDQKLTRMGYAKAYPLQFETYKKNMEGDPSPTGFGGAQAGNSHLLEQPEQIELFKGYKFSIQYDDDRGHWYAGQDILESLRRPGQKGSCIVCKGSYMYDVYFKESGWDFASKPFDEIAAPIKDDEWFGCSSCHDPDTMKLRVYNQGFVESMAEMGVDISQATHNEMRLYVCAQCHNEYFFTAEDGRVHMPFANGLDPEAEYKYYQDGHSKGFTGDWTHPDSGARMLKTQHPDFEVWADSIHALNGVTCVDCHMPYMRDNGQKYTSHWMTNPLKHYDSACSKCHDESYETMLHRVQTINDNTFKLLRIAGETTARAHKTIKAAHLAGATDEQLAESRLLIREAQWYWDWVSAESSMGFHNPDKCMKSLGLSIDRAHKAIESATAATKGTYTLEPLPTEPFTTVKFDDAIKPGQAPPAQPAPAPAQ